MDNDGADAPFDGDLLEIRRCELMGRSVHAMQDIKEGSYILETWPYAYCITWEERSDVCGCCLSLFLSDDRDGSVNCSKCLTRYCNDACANRAKAYHSAVECEIFQRVARHWPDIDAEVRERAILCSLILQRNNSSPDEAFFGQANFGHVQSMAKLYCTHESVVKGVLHCLSFLLDFEVEEALVRDLIAIETSNVFSIQRAALKRQEIAGDIAEEWDGSEISEEGGLKNLGSSLLVRGAYLNHSCDPNTARVLTRGAFGHTKYYTCKDICKGDELTISYLSFFESPFEARQRIFNRYYGFECCLCKRCASCANFTGTLCTSCGSLCVKDLCSICNSEEIVSRFIIEENEKI